MNHAVRFTSPDCNFAARSGLASRKPEPKLESILNRYAGDHAQLHLPWSRRRANVQGAIGGGGLCCAKAGAVDQEPEHSEGGNVLVRKHLGEIRLDVCGSGQRGIITHQAQLHAVGHDAPQGIVTVVQVVTEREGRGARPICRERRTAAIDLLLRRDNHHGHTARRRQSNRRQRGRQVVVAEGFLEETRDEASCRCRRWMLYLREGVKM